MPKPKITESEVEELINSKALIAEGEYTWKAKNKSWTSVVIPVRSSSAKYSGLKITLTHSPVLSRWSFTLLWQGIRIRGLCVNGSHTNNHTNNDVWTIQTHVHEWTDKCAHRFAKSSGTEVPSDIQEQLSLFMGMCGIVGSAQILGEPKVQGDMLDEL